MTQVLIHVLMIIVIMALSGCTNVLQLSTVVDSHNNSNGYIDGYPCTQMHGCNLETRPPIKGE